ncbi:MAG: hypothetical protein KGH72_03745 [Candidatus Micrarchaeota archaeon]|nr:hypothetical protein [Candidatus Micrarchaeota archaeon]
MGMTTYNMAPEAEPKRINTGVIGLDDILYGGVPVANQTIVSGDPGTGKTLLGFEILYRNAKINIPTTFITLEEGKINLIENVKSAYTYFDDIDDLIASKLLQVYELQVLDTFKSRENWQAFIVGINKIVQSNASKILVLDSLTPLRPLAEDDRTFTRSINSMVENFRNLGLTTFINTETNAEIKNEAPGLLGTYMFDGMIRLSTSSAQNSFQYLMRVIKMRRSNHRNSAMPYEVTQKGINVFK